MKIARSFGPGDHFFIKTRLGCSEHISDSAEHVRNLGAQQGQNSQYDERDQEKEQSVFDQALTLFVWKIHLVHPLSTNNRQGKHNTIANLRQTEKAQRKRRAIEHENKKKPDPIHRRAWGPALDYVVDNPFVIWLNTFATWGPKRVRIAMTTTATKTRINAYSTRP